MADAFEQDLAAKLDTPPALDGEEAFAAAIEARIARTWRIRRWSLVVACLAGIGVSLAVLASSEVRLGSLASYGLGASRTFSSFLEQAARSSLQVGDLAWLLAAVLAALAALVIPRLLAES